MIKKLYLLGLGLAAGHVLEHRLYLFCRAIKAKHMLQEEERDLAKAAMYLSTMQEGFELWLQTDEAQELIRQQREELGLRRQAAEEQAATS